VFTRKELKRCKKKLITCMDQVCQPEMEEGELAALEQDAYTKACVRIQYLVRRVQALIRRVYKYDPLDYGYWKLFGPYRAGRVQGMALYMLYEHADAMGWGTTGLQFAKFEAVDMARKWYWGRLRYAHVEPGDRSRHA
jgi:hypothetical protein